jgi:hypothetical protein
VYCIQVMNCFHFENIWYPGNESLSLWKHWLQRGTQYMSALFGIQNVANGSGNLVEPVFTFFALFGFCFSFILCRYISFVWYFSTFVL